MNAEYLETRSHLVSVLNTTKRKALVRRCAKILGRVPMFDAIAVTGLSGTIFGTSLSDAIGCPVVVVRKKENPEPHSGCMVEGPDSICDKVLRWVFVDDLISTGKTLNRVRMMVSTRYPRNECVGICLYQQASLNRSSWHASIKPTWAVVPEEGLIELTYGPVASQSEMVLV